MHNRRRYKLNESFFDTWSPEMAYVLGFWFADGYMTVDRSYRISFFSNDIQILGDIRRALESTNPIVGNNRDQSFCLRVHSKKLYEGLTRLGGFRAKSRTVTFPFVPKEYLRDFIRGYFDGDGSVGFINYIR